jgi:hypothetical protein
MRHEILRVLSRIEFLFLKNHPEKKSNFSMSVQHATKSARIRQWTPTDKARNLPPLGFKSLYVREIEREILHISM